VRVPQGVWAQRPAVHNSGSLTGELGKGRVPEGVLMTFYGK